MAADKRENDFDFIIVGGGIAAVSCAEYLSVFNEDATVCVISSSDLIKAVCNVRNITRNLTEFDVIEKPLCTLSKDSVTVVKDTVVSFDPTEHKVVTSCNKVFHYKKLCICSGAKPKLISQGPHVLGLRDMQSIDYFQTRLSEARKVAVIGNGGIALELVYELMGCEVVWVIKDDSIGNAYLDKGAAQFFLSNLQLQSYNSHNDTSQGMKTTPTIGFQQKCDAGKTCDGHAAALGYDWIKQLNNKEDQEAGCSKSNVHIEYGCEVLEILTPEEYYGKLSENTDTHSNNEWNLYVHLTNGKTFGCDFLLSATGVLPNTEVFTKCAQFDIAKDGGLKVDDHLRTNVCDVYAAGDVCSCALWDHSETWMQMRLWSQGNQMGAYAAKCMVADMDGEETMMDFCFELFAHVTRFFGYKVILLGKFNGQGLENYHVLLRCTKGQEYVKVVVHDGRIHGALLIGETDLEETLENLILNKMDVSAFGEDLLNPDVDIEDYFD